MREVTLDLWLVFYVVIGLTVGFFAGLLGVGGGAIMVPMMTYAFSKQGVPPELVLHVALGTGMATIIFTSLSSLWAHHGHGAVDWHVVRGMAPGLFAGGFAGSGVARFIPTFPLAIIFALFVTYAATQMMLDWKPRPGARLPGMLGLSVAGFFICGFSALVAIGGAALVIPWLMFCAVPFHRALGTAAAVGFPLALASTLGYVANGWTVPGLPSPHLGYVYIPAMVGIAVASVSMAPLGARLAHRVSPKTLRRVFAVVMYVMVVKMIMDLA
jgi:uncharacterized membrane protein YfcA